MANQYMQGRVVRLSVEFTSVDTGAYADPGGVRFALRVPDGTVTSYTYGEDGELVKDGTGQYHVDWTVAQEGIHWYKFTGTGANAAVAEAWFWGDEDRTE